VTHRDATPEEHFFDGTAVSEEKGGAAISIHGALRIWSSTIAYGITAETGEKTGRFVSEVPALISICAWPFLYIRACILPRCRTLGIYGFDEFYFGEPELFVIDVTERDARRVDLPSWPA
jgi:hypothetical protein